MFFETEIDFTCLVMIWAEDFNSSCAFAVVFSEWKEIKLLEAFIDEGSIPLSSEP